MILRFLGTHNAESKNTKLVSFLIDDVLAVDAGSLVSELTFAEQKKIKAILLSHGHYDHIGAIPAFAFNNAWRVTKVFGTAQTLQILSSHLFDGVVYPEFTSDDSYLGRAALQLVELKPFDRQNIEGYEIMAVPVIHPIDAAGFEISSPDGKRIFYTGDTGPGVSTVWKNISPELIIADVSLPNRLSNLARDAGHLCPQTLAEELIEFRRLKGYLPRIVIIHLSPQFESEIVEETKRIVTNLRISLSVAHEGDQLVV